MLPRRPMQRASLIIYIIYAVHRHIRCPPAPAMEPNPRGRGSDAGASAMNLRLPAAAAFAATLVCFAAAAAFAGDAAPEDDAVCTGRAPFREVAQDEIYTFAELCGIRQDFLRADRGRTGLSAVGWAKGRSAAPPPRN